MALATLFSPAHADFALNMREGVTVTSQSVYDLHMTIFWVCCIIGVVVFGAMIYSIVYHRKSKGAVAAQFHESTTMEILWTVVPIVILVSMAVPATTTLLAMEDTSNADVTIKVTGLQWRWKYDYVDGDAAGVSFISSLHPKHNEARLLGADADLSEFGDTYLLDVDNPLVIPTGQKVRFLLTAADVIHAWWVPDLGWKKTPFPDSSTRPGRKSTSRAYTVASAPNCVARITALCRSSSSRRRRRTTPNGSTSRKVWRLPLPKLQTANGRWTN